MILRYELPPQAEKLIELSGDERIYYAVPIDLDDDGIATLKYAIYAAVDMRFYCGDEIYDYDYLNGGQVIPLSDFR